MTESPDATEATRLAVEFLTVWTEADTEEKKRDAASYITRRLTAPDAPDRIQVIRGQLYLNELILLTLAKASGAKDDNLRTWGVEWLGRLSPQLPERGE